MMGGMFGFGGGAGEIFMVLWWVVIIAAIVLLVRWLMQFSPGVRSGKDALDILKERYARGDLSRDEYEKMRREIGR